MNKFFFLKLKFANLAIFKAGLFCKFCIYLALKQASENFKKSSISKQISVTYKSKLISSSGKQLG